MSRGRKWDFNSVIDIGAYGTIMMRRRRLIKTPLGGLYLHSIHRPDLDRDLHDHPGNFTTLVLRGGYTERHFNAHSQVVGDAVVRSWRRWSLHRMHCWTDVHCIDSVEPKTITIVLWGRKQREWGFHPTDGSWVGFREYEMSRDGRVNGE